MDVLVGLYKGSKSESKAISDGLEVFSVSEACEKADWIMILLPDEFQKDVYLKDCLLYTSPSPRDKRQSRMPSSA